VPGRFEKKTSNYFIKALYFCRHICYTDHIRMRKGDIMKSQTLFKSGYFKGEKEYALKIINNIVDGQTSTREFYVGNILPDGTFETVYKSYDFDTAVIKYNDIKVFPLGYRRVREEDLECKMLGILGE